MLSFFICGCTKNGGKDDLVLSTDILLQTSWSGNCTYGDIIDNFDIIFIDETKGDVLYDFHLNQPSEGKVTYRIMNGKLLTFSKVPSALHRLYGDWILDDIRDGHMRFLRDNYFHTDNVPVLELNMSR